MKSKKWQKPQLVVLLKGRTEEAVLCHCKMPNYGLGTFPYSGSCSCPGRHCKNNSAS